LFVYGKLYFGSEKNARKIRNLRSLPNVAVTVDLYSDDWSQLKRVMLQGTVTFVEKGPRFRRIRKLLYGKYPLGALRSPLRACQGKKRHRSYAPAYTPPQTMGSLDSHRRPWSSGHHTMTSAVKCPGSGV
jgi:hypothetical protein